MGHAIWDYWYQAIAAADAADWVTTAAYFLTAQLCWSASRTHLTSDNRAERLFWQVAAVALVFLGINELLDLQALLTALGKAHAQANGWYEVRRRVQFAFIVALSIGTILGAFILLWWTRKLGWPIRFAMLGFASIGVFILIRAASFHHIDDLLGRGFQTFNIGAMQEMAGILIIAASALAYRRRSA